MNFNGQTYINTYLAALRDSKVINDAADKYGVTLQEAQVADGQAYWRVIGVHHLNTAEGEGTHTVLVEALDEQNNCIRMGKAWAASKFDGQNGQDVKALDKGSSDPMGCDFPLFENGTYSVWMEGNRPDAQEPSERVANLHTRHPDEGPGVTFGHHSFYVLFQRTVKAPTALDEAAVLAMGRKLRDEQIAGDTAFAVFARGQKLGAPVTAEFNAGGYRARGYAGGIVYAPLARPNEIKLMAW